MMGIASPAPSGSKAPQHRLQATTHTEITQCITLAESYLLWTLVMIDYCPQGRMCFFTRTNFFPNKQNKSHKLQRDFYSLREAAAGQSSREAKFDLGGLEQVIMEKVYLTLPFKLALAFSGLII